MFVLLGIIIVIASFIIALISLVREQRKNEQFPSVIDKEHKGTIASEEEQQALTQEEVVKRQDEAAKRLEEMVKKQEAANVVDEAENLGNRGVDQEMFPWEKPVVDNFKTVGDLTEETKVEGKSPAETFDDITASSVDDGRTLTGVIELRRQAKEKKKAA